MDKFIYYNNLYLVYKDLLTNSYKEVFDLYYGDNLTMQEIADYMGISKSRVGKIIENATKKLDTYETNLHILKNNEELNKLLELNDIKEIKKGIEDILKGE